MITWKNFTGHLRTILRHKKLVRHYCFRAGLYKQGIMHDWSKYSPVEFINGVKYYQGGIKSPHYGQKMETGYSGAWLHHKGRNRHHFEYWIDIPLNTELGLQGMPMPTRYVLEMFCDRVAATRNYSGDAYHDGAALQYFNRNKGNYTMHPEAMALLEKLLVMLAEQGEDATFAYIRREIDWKHSPKW